MSLANIPSEGDWDEGLHRLLREGFDEELRRKFNPLLDENGTVALTVRVSHSMKKTILESCVRYLARRYKSEEEANNHLEALTKSVVWRMFIASVFVEEIEPIRRSLEADGVVWPLVTDDNGEIHCDIPS